MKSRRRSLSLRRRPVLRPRLEDLEGRIAPAGLIAIGDASLADGDAGTDYKAQSDELVKQFGPVRGESIVRAAGSAADLVFSLIERHGIACDAVRNGWIQAAHSPKISSRWVVTRNPERAPMALSTSARPWSSTSVERPQLVQIA